MDRRAQALPRLYAKALHDVADTLAVNLVRATPVASGRARSNWLASVGAEVDRVLEPYFPLPNPETPDPSKFTETANAQAAIDAAREVLASVPPAPETVYIQNSVEYIGLLNDGASAQTPKNFVRLAIIETEQNHVQGASLGLAQVK